MVDQLNCEMLLFSAVTPQQKFSSTPQENSVAMCFILRNNPSNSTTVEIRPYTSYKIIKNKIGFRDLCKSQLIRKGFSSGLYFKMQGEIYKDPCFPRWELSDRCT